MGVRFAGVGFSFGGDDTPLLAGLDVHAPAGRVTALVGASGCGKSTLLRLAAGLLEPTAGQVHVSAGARAFVFQQPTLLAWRTVAENVALPLELAGQRAPAAVASALAAVELGDAADLLPRALSGGMRMRASLARALVTQPQLLLLDEPFGALDALTRRRVQAVFQTAWRSSGATVLMVTHDIDEAALLADQVVALGGRPLRVVGVAQVRRDDGPLHRHHPEVARVAAQVEAWL